ncbi:hypothetical protein A1O7_08094 [Cladophialophora yegresii CBS 114405]|uniref:Non-structural maintenance of chromosomes element 4 n=1 Tax=Cladophialophora yegresii CBS 114405 TaxID=1182544 RepID=W9W9D3_9EURO|nr:uncharacterized protein A1O7_08094 [Cladophialophora yegresii CBS 114405]EXJ55169.1 hypothetical protein A1O7_08094 [Cladophialophora yegresii CBS 114405]
MARLNPRPASSDNDSARSPNSPDRQTPETLTTPPSPTHSDSGDEHWSRNSKGKGKRKSAAAGLSDRTPAQPRKRGRVGDDDSQTPPAQQFYDPEQAPVERRRLRKGFRSLLSELHDSRAEYLQPNSKGLEETLRRADELYKDVKQTSEATIDSRLILEAADLSYRKINNITLGDGTTGIDVDDFVTKCIGFMKQGDEPGRRGAPRDTQTQGRRRNQDDDEDDAGDTMNWEYLGRNACFLYNSRPCLTGFLLGPLSVQKKFRQQMQRKAREARTQPGEAVRPVQLGPEDLEKQESANLTEICTEIAFLLKKATQKNSEAAQTELNELEEMEDDVSEEQAREILRRNCIADNECIPLFNFCINPRSFGQSVENMFYVSFLIKEGKVGLGLDGQGLPTLGMAEVRSMEERQEARRNQVIFTLSMDIWEDIIESFGIKESIIPHRNEEDYDDGTRDYAHMEDEGGPRDGEEEDSDAYA